jgi:hypothetical protein
MELLRGAMEGGWNVSRYQEGKIKIFFFFNLKFHRYEMRDASPQFAH